MGGGNTNRLQRGRRRLSGVMDMFTIPIMVMVSQVYNMSKLKYVQFIVCQLNFNKAEFFF